MKIDDLANAFVDDHLDREGLREMTRLLAQDPEARRVFLRAVDQHETLRLLLGGVQVKRKSLRPWIASAAAVAAAAGLAIAAGLFFTRPREPEVIPQPIVQKRKAPPPAPSAPKEPEAPRAIEKKLPPEAPPAPRPPQEPEKPPVVETPVEKPREASKVEAPKPDPILPPAPPSARTVAAIASLHSVEGMAARGRVALQAGDTIFEGDTIEASAGRAAVSFPDGSRIELTGEMTLPLSRKISLAHGTLVAEIAKQPPGQGFVIATPHAEAAVLGTKLRLVVAAETRLEVKEGHVKLTRLDDGRSVDVAGGQYALAAKGMSLAVKKTTRGPMMAGLAIWGEDFQDPRAIGKDWRVSRNGVGVSYPGALEFDLHPAGDLGDASLMTEAGFAAPLRITVEMEFTHRLRGVLAGLRLGSWKEGKDLVHVDLDEERYYLTVGEKGMTADATRKNPRRERWSLELRGDGAVGFFVDGRELLRGRRELSAAEYHLTLLAKSRRETPAGSKLRFENLVLERMK